ncbi:DUF3253 domain-containing protein [Ornithinimicrobium panacihumi]|uniref:DUF3253 domain-containing protein n=1 Tax=Ornithinimicrobium panacihumi TaxID=2008449 RepID=UPI003F8CDAA6
MRPRDEPSQRPPLAAFVVVVPARDEEDEIGGALDAIARAARQGASSDALPVTVVTVLDRCADGTAEAVARATSAHPHVDWITIEATRGSLGGARGEGVEAGRAAYPHLRPDELWIASTDADSRVPTTWLEEQRELADRGLDLVLGTVEPVEDGEHPESTRLWHAQHHLVEGHTSIHAANLGVRLSAYDVAGGFPALDDSEDAHLVHRVREVERLPWTSTDRTRVLTSARRRGRAGAGFAGFLRRLDETVNAHGVAEALVGRVRAETLRLLAERGEAGSIDLTEIAEAVDPRLAAGLTHVARAVACQLADEGLAVVTQDGVVVDGRRTPGPVRIVTPRRPAAYNPSVGRRA